MAARAKDAFQMPIFGVKWTVKFPGPERLNTA